VKLLLAALGVAAAMPAAGATASSIPPEPVSLVFDWPLDCPVTVDQSYLDAVLVIDVSYVVRATEVGDAIAVRFGPAAVGEFDVGTTNADIEPQLAAFFTNPTIEVAADGSPVEAVGFEEWLEGFAAAEAGGDDGQLEREITHRAAVVTWESWVGLWAALSPLAGDAAVIDDARYVDEFLEAQAAPLEVVAEEVADGRVTLIAERTVAGEALAELWHSGRDPATAQPVEYEPASDQQRVTTIEVTADPTTLQPQQASYGVSVLDASGSDELIVAFEWTFDWPADCAAARSAADVAAAATATTTQAPEGGAIVPGFDTIGLDELPSEALDTLVLIELGGPFPYRQDGAVFENREGILPARPSGYYHEYTVDTPGSDDRGARRIVTGAGGEVFYTDDHYGSFRVVIE